MKDFVFQVDLDNSARFTQIKRTEYENKLMGLNVDDFQLNDYEFISAGANIKMHIAFPYLDSLFPIGINDL